MLAHPQTRLRIVAWGLFVVAYGATAEEIPPPAQAATTGVELHVPDVRRVEVSELGQAVATDRLSTLRGGDASQTETLIDVDGSVDGNTAHHITSGANSIADGAFSNASGINTVIQNTGSNVLIQNAMIVTVDFGAVPP